VLTGPGDKPVKAKKLKRKPTVVKAPAGDVASSGGNYGMPEANRAAKSNPTVRKDTRTVYAAQPTARKKQILKKATGATGQNIRHEHASRISRNQQLEHDQALHDVRTNGDIRRANAYLDAHPEVLHPDHPHHGSLIGTITGAADLGQKGVKLAVDAARSGSVKAAAKISGNMFASLPKNSNIAKEGAKNAGRELVDIPANTIPSLYSVAKQATEGRVAQAGGRHADAVHATENAAKILAQPYIDTAKHPIKSFAEHPLGTVLLASGAKASVGRGGGKALRAAPSKTLRRAGSTERPQATRTVPGTALREDRPYSKDAINKGVQVVAEKVRTKRTGSPVKTTTMSPNEIRTRVDETVAATEDMRRAHRAEAVKEAERAISTGAGGRKVKPTPAVTVAAQNVARPGPELDAYIAQLEQQAKGLTHHRLKQNKATVKTLKKAQRKANPADTEASARAIADMSVRQQAELAKRGLLDPAEQAHARLVPYAVQRMKAHTLTEAETRALVERAREHHQSAVRELAAQERVHKDSLAGFGVARGRAQVLSRNVGGTAAERRATARTVRDGETQFAGGGLGVDKAAAAMRKSVQNVEAARTAVSAADRELAYAKRVHANHGHLVDEHGNRLTVEQIRAHMAAHGHEEPAFVTHAPNMRGAKNFYVPTTKAPQVHTDARTGAAVKQGTVDYHPETLVEQSAKSQGLIDAHDGFQAFVHEFGMRGGSGKLKTLPSYKRAMDVAESLKHERGGDPNGSVPMRPVRLNPFLGRQAQLDALVNGVDVGREAAVQHVKEVIHDALSGKPDDGPGQWVLVPEDAAVRLQEHEAVGAGRRGPVARVANLYGSTFRKNVLAFSPVWLGSNIVEAAVRSMIGHVGPRSAYTGFRARQTLKRENPALALDVRSRAAGGGNYSLDRRTSAHTEAEHFAGTRLARIATAMGKMARTPGPKQLVDLYHVYTDFVFHSLNGRIEGAFQTAMLGKALRDSPLMSANVVKLSRKAIDDATRGLNDVNTLAALGREVDAMYGRYGKFSPTMRRAIAAYTPFVAWTLNASKFLYLTMPKDHPVLTSVLTSANQASEEWRKEHGLYFDPFGETPGQAPVWLQGSIPGKNGSHLRASRYTPFGLVPGGLEGLSGLLLPQLRDVMNAFEGQKWNGQKIRGPGGGDATQAQRAAAAATALIETTIPGLSLGEAASKGDLGKRVPFRYTQSKAGGKEQVLTEPKPSRDNLPPLPRPPSTPQSLPKLPGTP
jgi:hypothetical protein